MEYVSFDNMLMYYFKHLSDLLNLPKKKNVLVSHVMVIFRKRYFELALFYGIVCA